jgi:hypothetical protein
MSVAISSGIPARFPTKYNPTRIPKARHLKTLLVGMEIIFCSSREVIYLVYQNGLKII